MYAIYKLLEQLRQERQMKYKNGIYYYTQVELAYNSNRIEGSKLKREHTASLFSTKSLLTSKDEIIRSDDIIETTNHFRAFDFLLDSLEKELDEIIIKELHRILKSGTSDADISWFKVGDYKTVENMVADIQTTAPKDVEDAMYDLLDIYNSTSKHSFEQILQFHVKFERIHPFQDGNGRVGRLIMFRECLKNNIIPFIIDADHQDFYYRGLREYFHESAYLRDTCLSAQDKYVLYCKKFVNDFIPKYEKFFPAFHDSKTIEQLNEWIDTSKPEDGMPSFQREGENGSLFKLFVNFKENSNRSVTLFDNKQFELFQDGEHICAANRLDWVLADYNKLSRQNSK